MNTFLKKNKPIFINLIKIFKQKAVKNTKKKLNNVQKGVKNDISIIYLKFIKKIIKYKLKKSKF